MTVGAADIGSREEALRELLQQSQTLTQEGVNAFSTFGRKLREVDRLVQPVASRTNAVVQAREVIRNAKDQVDEVLENLDTAKQIESQINFGPQKDFGGFFRAFERLEASIEFLQNHRQLTLSRESLNGSYKLRTTGLKLCVDYFATLFRENTSVPSSVLLAHEEVSAHGGGRQGAPEVELMPAAVCKRLRRLSDCLLRNSDTGSIKIYWETRRGVLARIISESNESIASLRDPNVSESLLEEKTQAWLSGIRKSELILKPERQLAATVFGEPFDASAFQEVVAPSMSGLLALGQAICGAGRPPAKLLNLVDMYNLLDWLLPCLPELLSGPKLQRLFQQFLNLVVELQTEARNTFAEFEAELQRPNNKALAPDGSVHRLAVNTMAFLKQLFTKESALYILFSQGLQIPKGMEGLQHPVLRERVVTRLRSVLDLLIKNLDAKTKNKGDKNRGLGLLFMMNNLHYIVTRVTKNSALNLLGEQWVDAQSDQVDKYGLEYVALTWGPLITLVDADVSKIKVKEQLRLISGKLDELITTQGSWQIPDDSLRENMRGVICSDFVEHYKLFLDRMDDTFPGKLPKYEKYIKFKPEDVRLIVNHTLFGGDKVALRSANSLLDLVGH